MTHHERPPCEYRAQAQAQPRTNMTTSRDWSSSAQRHDAAAALVRDIRTMSEEAESGVRMCHAQGKTAVFLSGDERFIVEHEPNGTIRRTLLQRLSQTGT